MDSSRFDNLTHSVRRRALIGGTLFSLLPGMAEAKKKRKKRKKRRDRASDLPPPRFGLSINGGPIIDVTHSSPLRGITGPGAKWAAGGNVFVNSYLSGQNLTDQKAIINQVKAQIPEATVSFAFNDLTPVDCKNIPAANKFITRRIVACINDTLAENPGYAAVTYWSTTGTDSRGVGYLGAVRIEYDDGYLAGMGKGLICHESMHATTGISDDYGSEPNTSCVHGNLQNLGSFDNAWVQYVYDHCFMNTRDHQQYC